MKLKHYIFFLLALIGLFACSDKSDCVIADSIAKVKTITMNNESYTLILRTSGFHEKVSFYELYESSPIFDMCGKTTISPVSEEVIEETTKGSVSKLIIKGHSLQIVYSKKETKITDFSNIPVEVK